MLSNLWAKIRPVLQFKVRRWHTSMRGWTEQNARVFVNCETDIWYWALAEFLSDLQSYFCSWTHNIPLPGFICNIKGHWDKDDPEYLASFGDWFGDDLGGLWHGYICDPCLEFVWKHKSHDEAEFELTLDEARKKFAHDPEQYQWVEKSIEERKRWDAESLAEIRAAYRSGEMTRERALEKLSFVFSDLEDDQLLEILDKQGE